MQYDHKIITASAKNEEGSAMLIQNGKCPLYCKEAADGLGVASAKAIPLDADEGAEEAAKIRNECQKIVDSDKIATPELMRLLGEQAADGGLGEGDSGFEAIIADLREEAAKVPDARQAGKVDNEHQLADMLVVSLLALLRGSNSWAGFARLPKANSEWLGKCGVRCVAIDDTYRNAFAKIDANSVLQCLGGFFAERVERLLAARGVAPEEKRVISCDGKQNLSSGLGGVKKANILSAFDSETGAVLAQELIEEKTNEITAMPDLIAHVGEAANGAIFTWDALNTTAKIVEEVIKAQGNYGGAIKGDAGLIYGDAAAFFDMAAGIGAGTGKAIALNKGVSTLRSSALIVKKSTKA
jgi:hypothetical protein